MKKILLFLAFSLLFFLQNCSIPKKIFLTSGWRYHLGEVQNFQEPELDDSEWEQISLPHTLRIEPARFKRGERYYRGVGVYRLRFSAFQNLYQPGDRVLIHFEGALTKTEVWLNGKYLGFHLGGYTPFTFDLTDTFLPDQENLLAVRVDNSKMKVPPEGMLVDYTLFGGIYREVWIELKSPVYLEKPFAYSAELNEKKALLKISAEARNSLAEPLTCKFTARLKEEGYRESPGAKAEKQVRVPPGKTKVELEMSVENPKLWSPDFPYLYQLSLGISCPDPRKKPEEPEKKTPGEMGDVISFNYGFRWFEFTNQGFLLNGKRVQLLGMNRHQSFPYLGNAGGFRLQYLDALLLKESGMNFIRLSHYPQSPDFLDACDHLGLMVFEELPGWGYVGDKEWKKLAEQALREMILRDRNHPSIILWGVRINEAWWGEKWLEKMIKPARELDPTRPTSGARLLGNFRNMKEDVIAHNDYSGGLIKPPTDKPWMVSEYSVGATNLFTIVVSDAQHLSTVRHNAYLLDLILSEPSCAGSTGWAFADYNTFMSRLAAPDARERIRRHGMVDIFRIKKPIYYFYQAQTAKEPMVKIVNQFWQKEDFPGEVMVVGNCEQVRLILNDKELGVKTPEEKYTYPAQGAYQSLPYPPFSFSHFKFEPGELIAQCLIKGEVKAEDRLRTPKAPARIQISAGEEFTRISPKDLPYRSDSYSDPIRIIARLTDEEGNPVKDQKNFIKFSAYTTENWICYHPTDLNQPPSEFRKTRLEEIIGENPFKMENGTAVVFLRLKPEAKEEDEENLPECFKNLSFSKEGLTSEKEFEQKLKNLEFISELRVKAELISDQLSIPAEEVILFRSRFSGKKELEKMISKPEKRETTELEETTEEFFAQPEKILQKLFREKAEELF